MVFQIFRMVVIIIIIEVAVLVEICILVSKLEAQYLVIILYSIFHSIMHIYELHTYSNNNYIRVAA